MPQHLQAKHKTIADLRLSELECARQYLDFKDVFLLDYRDSGMTGSETSRHPDSLCYQWEHHPECVDEDRCNCHAADPPTGGCHFQSLRRLWASRSYSHSTGNRTRLSLLAQGRCARNSQAPKASIYAAFPTAVLWARILTSRLKGQDPRRMGINKDIDIVKILGHVEATHARIPIAQYLD